MKGYDPVPAPGMSVRAEDIEAAIDAADAVSNDELVAVLQRN